MMTFSYDLLKNGVNNIILVSSSYNGFGTLAKAILCSSLHLFGHFPVLVIDQNILETGIDSSGANSLISLVGRSPRTPPLLASDWMSS